MTEADKPSPGLTSGQISELLPLQGSKGNVGAFCLDFLYVTTVP